MVEIFAACITTIDVVIVFSLLRLRKGRLPIAIWTTFLNILFPFVGFLVGDWSTGFLSTWSGLLSGILLSMIGIHMILHDDDTSEAVRVVNPVLIALAVSLDTFSVSVSFGMLQLNKFLFILSSGLLTLVFSCTALYYGRYLSIKNGKILRWICGLSLFGMGVISCFG
ncbi:manganese efflux pump [Sporosarcina thermotolerans]|uniref:Manganese efflux pump n=1 Tax=Sporosarcina thermotolerans TaxID=633404 RepID=A0AAW9A5P7_9BACL|nr:manganese efflux pump [Sporosarcina thermotolerans]MDW0116392.1 manganese efflux pump [Sporosarcina thermotolerans]WHT48350.1 manganese efflux pump [Sporosarcina thermotolerans]